ncbi:hypothetical protein C942_02095 [Photobacterium marinum]|uniref:Uncharacterized protein n=1 Tax=Photobacterium marinum TaxID=1056511 RepID=L8JC71_9GAMM|nr:hypothetical protein C942_02095 [Photobacterium marinum]
MSFATMETQQVDELSKSDNLIELLLKSGVILLIAIEIKADTSCNCD